MALLPYNQIGDNLYADSAGKYFNLSKGYYTGSNGQKQYGEVRNYVQSPFESRSSQLNAMYDAQRKSQLDQLRSQQQRQLKEIKPVYQNQRNQTDVVNAQNVSRLRELMAANGINASGENVTASANLASQRQAAMNDINTNEQNTINEINDPAREQEIINAIEAQRTSALTAAYDKSQEDIYRQRRDFVEDSRYGQEKAWREYTYKNMSAAERATLDWAKQQYGEDAAWRMFELQYSGELQKSQNQAELDLYSNFTGAKEGGGYTNNYKSRQLKGSPNYQAFQSHMNSAVKRGLPSSWVEGMIELIGRESSWNPKADNPTSTAYGYGQFLDSTRSNYEKKMGMSYSDPVNQILMMAQYVKDRYGTPEKALQFWDKNKWY